MNTQIIACSNQKGGTAKTTTCVNLGIGLTREVIKLEKQREKSRAGIGR